MVIKPNNFNTNNIKKIHLHTLKKMSNLSAESIFIILIIKTKPNNVYN